MSKVFLKIKCMSLGAEAKMIRKEELKWPGESNVRTGLYRHRIDVVRMECRSAHLAYGFLRGRSYKQMEASCHSSPDWNRVQKLVEKYGAGDQRDLRQRFSEWKDAA